MQGKNRLTGDQGISAEVSYLRDMKRFLILAALLLSVIPVRAQEGYVPSAANLAAREQFAADRFGIFIHWGLAVLLDGGSPVPFRQEKRDRHPDDPSVLRRGPGGCAQIQIAAAYRTKTKSSSSQSDLSCVFDSKTK